MNWLSHYETTEDIDLGSLGGTLKAGALIRPMPHDSSYKGNVVLLSLSHWEGKSEGQPGIIGGWPDYFEGLVKQVRGPDQERWEAALERHKWPTMPVCWASGDGGINLNCPNCHNGLHSWLEEPPEGEHGRECKTDHGGCGAYWDKDENGRWVSSLGPCTHAVMTVKVHQVSTWVVLNGLPKDHGYPDGHAWLARCLCACGATSDTLVPEPEWSKEIL